jgi:hypothetical protein
LLVEAEVGIVGCLQVGADRLVIGPPEACSDQRRTHSMVLHLWLDGKMAQVPVLLARMPGFDRSEGSISTPRSRSHERGERWSE